MATLLPNGVYTADKVAKDSLRFDFPEHGENVIGVDFGTSTLAVAYVTADSHDTYLFKIDDKQSDSYVPTVLLVEGNGDVEIGFRAQERYTELEADIGTCVFFNKVKLELQHNKVVSRDTTVRSVNGIEYYLIEVIATILKKLKEKLRDFFRRRQNNIDSFDWVLTIPALWGIKARDMMREAAYMAGLCTDYMTKYLPTLRPTSSGYKPSEVKQLEPNPDKLALVFEPEAASACCQYTIDDVHIGTNECFLTVDIGGGTIDITANQLRPDGSVKILDVPHGRVYGGTMVNQEFKKFLEKDIVRDPGFSRYLRKDNFYNQHCAELYGIIENNFEGAKKRFGSENEYGASLDGFHNVPLPFSFAEVYRVNLQPYQGLEIGGSTHVSYKKSLLKLSISKEKMKTFFEESIRLTKQCINDVLSQVGRHNVKVLFLVGGFGGCQYIATALENHYRRMKVLHPEDPQYAVARGACLFPKRKFFRVADGTYGYESFYTYDSSNSYHRRAYKMTNDKNVSKSALFVPFINKGDEINPKYVFYNTSTPMDEDQETMLFSLYCSTDQYAYNTRLENGSPEDDVEKIGSVTINISKGMHLPRAERKVQFVMDFSSTEIHAYAWFAYTGERVQATCDFLSTTENVKRFGR